VTEGDPRDPLPRRPRPAGGGLRRRLQRLDDGSLLAECETDQVEFFAPLNCLLAMGFLVAAVWQLAHGQAGPAAALGAVSVTAGLFGWAGMSVRRRGRR
jgi:hypothetical protein